MPTQPNIYNDGAWNVGFNYGADRTFYPFLNNPTKDTNTKLYEVSRGITALNYAPQAALATYETDPNAYLVEETDITVDDKGKARYLLRYSRVPENQIIPDSKVVTRPVMHGINYGTNYAVSFDLGYTSTVFQNPPVANTAEVGYINTAPNQVFPGVLVYQPNHGGAVGDKYAAWTTNTLMAFGAVAYVPNVNYWIFPTRDVIDGYSLSMNYAQFAKNALVRYVNGPQACTIKRNQVYYLPGVTPGINTFADIPVYSPNINPVSWFQQVMTNAAWTLESVAQLQQWKGPIIMQELQEVQMADAKDTVSLTD